LKKYLLDYAFLIPFAATVVALDQWTKWLVRTHLAFQELWAPWDWLLPYARIVHWKNSGAAFGMLQGFGGIFNLLSILVSLAILYFFPQVPRKDWTLRLAMGLQLGGALGNLVDRLTTGYVIDFISVGTFPVFNVADASISIGVAVLLLGVWLQEKRQKTGEDPTAQETLDPNFPGEMPGE